LLPAQLSEMLCSLGPNEDKVAVTIDMFVQADGSVIASQFYRSLIRSSLKLSYD